MGERLWVQRKPVAAPGPARGALLRRQRREGTLGLEVQGTEVSALVRDGLSAASQPLDAASRAQFEPQFGHDFSQVRVHADERAADSAAAVNALAYTVGHDIVFGAGRFAPETSEGQRLIAHELTHVVQQDAGTAQGTALADGMALSDPTDGSERAADAAAELVLDGKNAAAIAHPSATSPMCGSGVTVQRDEDDDRLKLQAFPPGLHTPLGPLGLTVTPGKTSLDYQQGLFNAGAEYQYGGPASLSLGYGAPLLPWRSDLEGDVSAGAAGLAGLAGGQFNFHNVGALSNALSTLGDVNESASKLPWGIGAQGQYSPDQWRVMMGLRLNF